MKQSNEQGKYVSMYACMHVCKHVLHVSVRIYVLTVGWYKKEIECYFISIDKIHNWP